VLPAVTAAYLINGWPNVLAAAAAGTGVSLRLAEQAPWRLIAAGVLAMLPMLAMALALLRASRCLAAFARGEHFSLAAVRDLRGFAALVLLAGIACTLVPTLIVLLLTLGRPGQASLALSFDSQHLLLLLFAGVTWQIARVLAKAVALAEEHAQIV
jgi:Protein of unknown function (DUF2975)